MTNASIRAARWRPGLAALLLALAMRLLVPTGFMWEPAADGGARLVPCRGMAAASAAHDMHHMPMAGAPAHDKDHGNGDGSSRECAFSALGGALDLAEPFVAAPRSPVAIAALVALFVGDAAPGRGLAAPPPPSRGPPATF